MNDTELDAKIAAQPYEKVTKEGLEAKIKATDYHHLPNSTVTICNLTLENGFSVRGESACVDPRNFNLEIGRGVAYREAFGKLWALEGYLLMERRYQRTGEISRTDPLGIFETGAAARAAGPSSY